RAGEIRFEQLHALRIVIGNENPRRAVGIGGCCWVRGSGWDKGLPTKTATGFSYYFGCDEGRTVCSLRAYPCYPWFVGFRISYENVVTPGRATSGTGSSAFISKRAGIKSWRDSSACRHSMTRPV